MQLQLNCNILPCEPEGRREGARRTMRRPPPISLPLSSVLEAIHNVLDAGVENTCITLVGIDSAYSAAVIMFCASLMVVIVPFCMLVRQLNFARSVRTFRVASTMEPPVLLLGEGNKYHLFLCAAPRQPSQSLFHTRLARWQEPHLEHWTGSMRRHQETVAAALARGHVRDA